MIAISNVESARLALQRQLDAAKTQAERNRLGQFATPTVLATEILAYAASLLSGDQEIRFLDPAIGTGSFYSALLRTVPASRIASAVGYEIDPHYGCEAGHLWANDALQLQIADFTQAEPPHSDGEKANLLICNPPYVRHHHLTAGEKRRLQRLSKRIAGVALSGLAGLYCYFLCIAHGWLAKDGLAGWLIPSEFMDVNYGRQIKEHLLNRVTLLRIHRFDPNDVQFDDALVSSAVVWFRNAPPPLDHEVEFSYGGSLAAPHVSRHVPISILRNAAKWSHFPWKSEEKRTTRHKGVTLSDLFKIQRGIATGANSFFIVSPEQAVMYQLPKEFLTPILPSPRYLPVNEVEADSDGSPILERRLFLLRCSLPESVVKATYPSLWRYLQMGVESGISERYLCRHRSPWYTQEERLPAPLLCTYMGRQDGSSGTPFRFILNHSTATAPNVYLLLYPKPILRQHLKDNPDRLTVVWRALNSISLEALLGEGRVYGGGLHKMEPKELGNAAADEILAVLAKRDGDYLTQMRLFDD